MSQKSILSFFKQADKSLQNQSDNLQSSIQSPNRKTYSKNKSPKSSKVNGHNEEEDASNKSSSKSPEMKKTIIQAKKDSSNKNSSKTSKTRKTIDEVENDSPIKQTRKRKLKQIIDSDEDSNEVADENLSVAVKKKSKTIDEGKGSKKQPRKKKVLSSSDESENDSSSKTPLKKLKKENDENPTAVLEKEVKINGSSVNGEINGNVNHSVDAMDHDGINEKSKDTELNSSEITVDSQPSTSSNANENNSEEFIPKRKTARKSLRTAKKASEENVSEIKQQDDKKVEESEQSPEEEDAEEKSPKEKNVKEGSTKGKSPKGKNAKDSTNGKSPKGKSPKGKGPKKGKKSVENNEKNKQETSIVEENNEKLDSKIIESSKTDLKDDVPIAKSKENKEEPTNAKSPKKSQAIHPFFARKDTKNKINEETKSTTEVKEESTKRDTKLSNSTENETLSDKDSNNSSDENKEEESKKTELEEQNSDTSNEKLNKKKLNASTTSSGVLYDPSKNKYHPINDACWKYKEKVPYIALAKTLELIENTSARLKIVEILANFFRSVIILTPEDLLQSVYLCLNRIAPEYEGIELGIGDMLLMKAVAQATGRTLEKVRAEVKEKGDLGLVAESSRGNQKVMFAPPKLTVASVFSKFKEIAKMSGNASMARKTDKIQVLFVACRDCEARYIIRSLSGKLRIGLAEQSVLAALGRACVMTPPGQSYPPEVINKSSEMSSENFKKLQDAKVLILKTTYCECPNYDLVIPVLLKEGIDGLPKHCQLSPGCPLKPMLAHPTAGIDEVLRRFDNNEFTCEYKYDGERAQIHRTEKGEIKIFSRNQEDNTSKYPDIIARISKALKESTKSFILDTESVAWDREEKQILPFQILSTRKKKDAVESEIVVQVCVMAFDLLYLNGESLVKKPLKERRQLLHSSFVEVENEFMFVTYKDGNSAETMQEFLDESIKGNCEGLMVKALEVDASYEIAKRSHNWLKLKKDYLEGVGDTLDLVVIGGYHGKGKRTGTYGGFLLACYDEDNEEFQSICKLGTGFKEDELDAHTKFLKQHVIKSPKSYYRFDSSLEPDEWFEAVQTWEIKCADLSISPIHKAAIGIVDPEKGISLRFPRFLRIREDKKPEEATNSSQIAEMYQNQDQVQNMKNIPRADEDYY